MRWWPYLVGAAAVVAIASAWPQAPDPGHFVISAVYDSGEVVISFEDESGGTGHLAMEILGMGESLRRTYDSPQFTDRVAFAPPRYGWAAHPVIFYVDHDTLGEVRIKTEIRPAGEAPAPLVFERP